MHRPEQNVPVTTLIHRGSIKDSPGPPAPIPETVSNTISERDQFLYTVTHDLKAELRALTELPGWVEDDLQEAEIAVPRQVREHLHLMRRSARDLTTLLEG